MTRKILCHLVVAALVANSTLTDSPCRERRLFPRAIKDTCAEIADAAGVGRNIDSLGTRNERRGPLEVGEVSSGTQSTVIQADLIPTKEKDSEILKEESRGVREKEASTRQLFKSRSMAQERIAKHLDSVVLGDELLNSLKSKSEDKRVQFLWNAAEFARRSLTAAEDMDSRIACLEGFNAMLLTAVYFPEEISTKQWVEVLEQLHNLAANPKGTELLDLIEEMDKGMYSMPVGSKRKLLPSRGNLESNKRAEIGGFNPLPINTFTSSNVRGIIEFAMSDPRQAEEVFGKSVGVFIINNLFTKALSSDALLLTWIKMGFENSKDPVKNEEALEEVYKNIALYINEVYISAYWIESPHLRTKDLIKTEQDGQAQADENVSRVVHARENAKKRVLHVFSWFSEEILSSKQFSEELISRVVDILQRHPIDENDPFVEAMESKANFLGKVAEDVKETFEHAVKVSESKARLYDRLNRFRELTEYEKVIEKKGNPVDKAAYSAALALLNYNYRLQIILENDLVLDKTYDAQAEIIKEAFGQFSQQLEESLVTIREKIGIINKEFSPGSYIPRLLKSLLNYTKEIINWNPKQQ